MNSLIKYILILFLAGVIACEPDTPADPEGNTGNQNTGTVEFDFPLPNRIASASGIHRIDLSLALTGSDLYRGDFLITANVSDRERLYTFRLEPGDYYFQAGITCSCLGDTCLWDGFPGGRYGTKWAMDRITVVKGKTLVKVLAFNQ